MDHLPYVVLVQDNCDTKRERTHAIRFATRKAADEAVNWIGVGESTGAFVVEDDPAVIAAERDKARAARLAEVMRVMNGNPRANVPMPERPTKSVMDVLTEARRIFESSSMQTAFDALANAEGDDFDTASQAFVAFANAAGAAVGNITGWEDGVDRDDVIAAFSLAIARENPHKPRPNV